MRHRWETMTPRRSMVTAGSIVLYLLIGIVLLLVMFHGEETESVFGSVEGRFLSDITMEYAGCTYYYRENEITNYLILVPEEEAGSLSVLRLDREEKTVTPVTLDLQNTELPASDADASVYTDMARSVEELLYGVKIDHTIVMTPEAAAALRQSFDSADKTAQIPEQIHSLSDQIRTDIPINVLLQDVRRAAEYSRCGTQTLHVEDPAEEQTLRETIIGLWFRKGS